MAQTLTKSAYAAHAGVKPAAVSNWIARQRLTPPALRADGSIDVALADRQLGRSVDVMRSAAKREPAAAPGAGAEWSPRDQAGTQLLRARALSASVDAERKRRELNLERGKYMLTAQAEAEWAQVLVGFLTNVEQSLTDLANTLGLDRNQQIVLRKWWRERRAAAAAAHAAAAVQEAEFAEDVAA